VSITGVITEQTAGDFDDAAVGMVAWVENNGGAFAVDQRYKITAVSANAITISAGLNDSDVDVYVGGAFDSIQSALDVTDATSHSVKIYTNLGETLSASIDHTCNGSIANNTTVEIVGYNTILGDMNIDGAFYQSPTDALKNGIDLTKCVTLNNADGAWDAISFTADDGITYQNIHVTNGVDSGELVYMVSESVGLTFNNCKFSDGWKAFNCAAADYLTLKDCFITGMTSKSITIGGTNNVIQGCIHVAPAGQQALNIAGGTVRDSIFIVGLFVLSRTDNVSFHNNVFYNQTLYCLSYGISNNALDVYNNIFMPAAGASDNAMLISASGGSVDFDYNCYWGADGVAIVAPFAITDAGTELPVVGEHDIVMDPQFRDAAGGDFRAVNPLLKGIGAVEYKGIPNTFRRCKN
jgi:hypothetical protein